MRFPLTWLIVLFQLSGNQVIDMLWWQSNGVTQDECLLTVDEFEGLLPGTIGSCMGVPVGIDPVSVLSLLPNGLTGLLTP